MDGWLRQSTAANVLIGPFIDDTDGKTAETAVAVTDSNTFLSKNGAAQAVKHETTHPSHDALGYYICALDTTDTDTLGRLKLVVHIAGSLPVFHTWQILPANIFDSLVAGSDLLDVSTVQWTGTAVHAPGTAGVPLVDIHDQGTVLVDAIWDEVVNTGHATANSAAKLIADNINAPIGTVTTDVAAVHTHVGTIDGHITADYTATEKTCIDLLDDAAGGLADIHTDVGTVITNIGDVHATDLPAVMNMLTDIHGTDLPAVKADTAAILVDTGTTLDGRIPAALIGGKMDTHVNDIAAGAITAAAIATDAIDADALATNAITEIQTGLATPTNITAGTMTTVTNLTNFPAAAATAAELAKVPKSDSTVSWNATALAAINTQADTAISDAALATATNLAAAKTVIDNIHDTDLLAVKTDTGAIKTTTDKVTTAMEADAAVYRFTTNALEMAPSGSGLDAAGVRTAIGLATANLDTQLGAVPTLTELNAAIAGIGGVVGSGAIKFTYTCYEADGVTPLPGVAVWVSTDTGGTNIVAGTLVTDVFGVVSFMLDAGTYYVWRQLAGWTFSNPDTEVVS